MARLKEQYVNEIAPALNKKFGYKSVMQIPKLDKVVINVATKHQKPQKQGQDGGIIKVETPIYACKVQLVCPKCGKATRVAHKITDGKKTRVCKKCGAEI